MKIRSGFVSNSSSSSFVVLFPKEPKCAEDVKNMLFSEGQTSYYYNDSVWSVEEVAETVWRDICLTEKNNFERAKEIISGCSNYDYADAPDYDDFKSIKNTDDRWEAYNNAMDVYANKKLKEFFNIRKLKLKKLNNESIEDGSVLYTFEYSDNDSSFSSALEHGGLFDKLKNITVSNH